MTSHLKITNKTERKIEACLTLPEEKSNEPSHSSNYNSQSFIKTQEEY